MLSRNVRTRDIRACVSCCGASNLGLTTKGDDPVKRFLSISALMVLLVLSACRTTEVRNIESEPHFAPESATMAEIKKGIIRAGLHRDWLMQEIEPGHLEAKVDVRGKHSATVDIFFDKKKFSILYKDSQNMKYNGNTIHSNYMNWVENLKTDIRKEMSLLRVS